MPSAKAWIGLDIGLEFHWACALDEEGRELLSRRVENQEADLVALIAEVEAFRREEVWAVDMTQGPVALAAALLVSQGRTLLYVPGLVVNRSRQALAGEGKSDRRDARVIAENARLNRRLARLRVVEDSLVSLRLLVGHRRDLVQDRTRAITRLRSTLVEIFPGLERRLDLRRTGALELLRRYQAPAKLRRAGAVRVQRYLEGRHVIKAEALARKAHAAALGQSLKLPGEDTAARLIADMAGRLLELNQQIAIMDQELEACFFSHPQARIITSLPGMGPCLGAEFLVAVGGTLESFSAPDALAAYAGLAPVSADSGLTQGRRRRARGGNKQLKRVFYQSAFASLRHPASRRFYDRKRSEGKRHHQAVLALARRRVNVLWAMLRDERLFEDLPLAA